MILDRMVARLHARVLLVVLGVLVLLGLVIDFFESARYLLTGEGTAIDILQYYFYKLPGLAYLLLPLSLVIATGIAFALLGGGLELRAVAAAGVGPLRLSLPVLAVAGAVVAAEFLLSEFILPPSLDRVQTLMVERFGRMDASWYFFRKRQWYQGQSPGRIFQVGFRTPDGGLMRDVTLYELDLDFHLRRRTHLARVAREGGRWVGGPVVARAFEDGRLTSLRRTQRELLDWAEGPEQFRDLSGWPRQKTFAELVDTVEDMERRGQPARSYRVELHNRLAFPLLGFFLVLLWLPWLSSPSRARTLSAALTEAIGVIFGAYFLVGMAQAAVTGGLLSTAAGVWLPVGLVALSALPKWIGLLRGHLSGMGG